MNRTKNLISTTLKIASTALFIAGIISYPSAFAAKRKFPHGCRSLGYEFPEGLLLLNPGNLERPKTLYFIHNVSRYNIHFKVKKLPDQPFSPSYENVIYHGSWGAFALNEKALQFVCSIAGYHDARSIDCSEVLRVCQYNNVKFSESTIGTYWVVKSNSMRGTMREAINTGILLRW